MQHSSGSKKVKASPHVWIFLVNLRLTDRLIDKSAFWSEAFIKA